MEPVEAAGSIARSRFPQAIAVFLGGSSTGPRRTPTSDLDIVVVCRPASDGVRPFRETIRSGGWLVELFVHTPTSLRRYWDLDAELLRPTLVRMCADGVQVLSVAGAAERIHSEAADRLRAGAPTMTAAEWASRRYELSDLLDDLRSAGPPELTFIANAVLAASCETALLAAGGWLGTGKWLARELEGHDPKLLTELTSAHAIAVKGDAMELLTVANRVLERVGGPLTEGYRAEGAG